MTDEPRREGISRLGEAICQAIDYHVAEYDLTYDEVIGGIEIIKLGMYMELIEKKEDDDGEEGK